MAFASSRRTAVPRGHYRPLLVGGFGLELLGGRLAHEDLPRWGFRRLRRGGERRGGGRRRRRGGVCGLRSGLVCWLSTFARRPTTDAAHAAREPLRAARRGRLVPAAPAAAGRRRACDFFARLRRVEAAKPGALLGFRGTRGRFECRHGRCSRRRSSRSCSCIGGSSRRRRRRRRNGSSSGSRGLGRFLGCGQAPPEPGRRKEHRRRRRGTGGCSLFAVGSGPGRSVRGAFAGIAVFVGGKVDTKLHGDGGQQVRAG